ncbi:MAG: Rpn family recombination-promoting nuclease/putative transposase [Treponema sp.]|nr:Rpn family recombination-promoting nuclease/putative transposase [Treponema sp.]
MSRVYFGPEDDIIDPCWDNAFKAVFTKETAASKGALTGLLSALLDRKVKAVQLIANEPAVDSLQDRQIRYDIHCKIDGEELVDVEMTLHPLKFEPARIEYYAGELFTGQDIRGGNRGYKDLKRTYQISLLVNGLLFEDGEFLHEFEYYDAERKTPLGGRTRIITLELRKIERILEKPARTMTGKERWAVFFKYCTDKEKRRLINELLEYEEGITMASEALLIISRDEEERARLRSEKKYVLDRITALAEAREEGLEEGLEKGSREKAGEIAVNLLRTGLPAEQIAQITGLSADTVRSLQ